MDAGAQLWMTLPKREATYYLILITPSIISNLQSHDYKNLQKNKGALSR